MASSLFVSLNFKPSPIPTLFFSPRPKLCRTGLVSLQKIRRRPILATAGENKSSREEIIKLLDATKTLLKDSDASEEYNRIAGIATFVCTLYNGYVVLSPKFLEMAVTVIYPFFYKICHHPLFRNIPFIPLACIVILNWPSFRKIDSKIGQATQAGDDMLGDDHIKEKYLIGDMLGDDQLKEKYLEEFYERKRLYNEVMELKGNIRIFCRCRPLNESEIANGSDSVAEFDSSQDNELQIVSGDSSKKQFKFDHVFKPEDSQEAVFAQTKPIVTSVLDGYNVCIFAYGQTGTGKTFTMEGPPENRGVNYRTLEELFRISELRSSVMKYQLFVSMLEVYNEKIRDLLVENSNQPSKKLEIKQAADSTLEVPGLIEARAYGTEEVWELLKSGNKARSVGSTSANELSSRSHCLLRVTLKGENLINGQKTTSHLWLIDLAGSERVLKNEVEGERLKDSRFINKSLSALGDVIAALASKTSYIPFRNSKLTHMLQSSLGGDCKTLMFVHISPSKSDLDETICSLNFASRVRGIESGPARKQVDDPSEIVKYKQMVEALQLRVLALEEKVK